MRKLHVINIRQNVTHANTHRTLKGQIYVTSKMWFSQYVGLRSSFEVLYSVERREHAR